MYPFAMLTGVLANFFGYIIKGLGHFKALFKGAEGFKLLTPELMAARAASAQLSDEFYSDAAAAKTLSLAIEKLNADLNLLQQNATNIAGIGTGAGRAVTTIGGAPIMTMGGPRTVDPTHPLLGTESRAMRSAYRNLLENYSNNLQDESFSMIETLISCLNDILSKTKDNKLTAIIICAKAGLCAFLSQFSNEKSSNLELAYSYYKTAIELSVKHIHKLDLSRLRIAYSYAKFIFTKINDKYRSILFVLNVLEEIHQIQSNENLIDEQNENFNLDVFLKDLAKIERKFKTFHDKNIEEFNSIVRQYHPEYVG